ncbi:hypothetical protein [Yinghuangia seranimata]|uniref:hypothetical protein n=1 Tax=Yinghuangia seranimata TaxID=408067 RepID=UPI00248CDCE5|nr:hypothetical protein [Yinghuangia seranimata]MDI2128305.1 hypothetical protein [Yinghuangia seranimata]
MADLASVLARPLNRTAARCAGIAFGLAAPPVLLILGVLHWAGLTWLEVSGPGVIAFTLLAWPLTTRTNQGLIVAELISGTVLGFVTLLLAPWFWFIPWSCSCLPSARPLPRWWPPPVN